MHTEQPTRRSLPLARLVRWIVDDYGGPRCTMARWNERDIPPLCHRRQHVDTKMSIQYPQKLLDSATLSPLVRAKRLAVLQYRTALHCVALRDAMHTSAHPCPSHRPLGNADPGPPEHGTCSDTARGVGSRWQGEGQGTRADGSFVGCSMGPPARRPRCFAFSTPSSAVRPICQPPSATFRVCPSPPSRLCCVSANHHPSLLRTRTHARTYLAPSRRLLSLPLGVSDLGVAVR
ncbi:hypothetical protein B0H11DRAFT_2243517 [Mycena galericulata]|nr:hypothetical protein B0H11DRAFT_2243517 [Mycena galericulata]